MSALDRAAVENLLAKSGELPEGTRWIFAELCRSWLAVDAAPEAGLCIFNNAIRFREATNTTAIIAMVGKRVRLLALDSGGAGEVSE